jgi:putative serine/threonine protein kinase
MKLSRQNISFSDELEIDSAKLVPLVAYPRFSAGEYSKRIAEMRSLGVTALMIGGSGRSTINGIRIAGKGCVGLVIKARIGRRILALKILRTDANRKTMVREARLHSIANSLGVGPHLEGYTNNLIVMELVEGPSIVYWVHGASTLAARDIARSVLEQCFKLDGAGLDHGELSRLDRHIVITAESGKSACIIDFESASTTRRTSNVTAAAQSLFLYGAVANSVRGLLGEPDTDSVVIALRNYKRERSREAFDAVLRSLPL